MLGAFIEQYSLDVFLACVPVHMTAYTDPLRDTIDNSAIFAALLESQAIRWSAEVQAGATALAGALTLLAGVLAFFGAGTVLRNGDRDRIEARKREARSEQAQCHRMASTYAAEIGALWSFFDQNDVIGTLRQHAADQRRMDFTPGELWLRTYVTDPSTIGAFSPSIAAKIAYTWPRTLNELGRLRWLHKWNEATPEGRRAQQIQSADTLAHLRDEAHTIIGDLERLAAAIAPSREFPRS